MVTSLAMMAGAVMFALESYLLLPTAPWLSIPGFALAVVLFVGALWAYAHKKNLEDLPHSATRAAWWALLHALLATVGGVLAYTAFPGPMWIMQGLLALLLAARGIKIFVDRHKENATEV